MDEPATCPACGASVWTADGAMPGQQLRQAPGHPGGGMPMARVVTLVGGLGLLAAYFMPWFGSQGIMLTGAFLNQFLGTTPDLRRLVPGAVGGPLEVQLLRALVDFFPVAGGLGVVATLLVTLRPAWRAAANSVVGACGALALVALIGGVARLPPGATWEVGLWLIGASSLALLAGVARS